MKFISWVSLVAFLILLCLDPIVLGCGLIAGPSGLGACTGSCPAGQSCQCTDPIDPGCAGCGCKPCTGGPTVCGDPHFVGLHGEKYNVMGEPNKYFNILTDTDIQVNALYIDPCETKIKNATVLGLVGIKTASFQVGISSAHEVFVDGVKLDPISFPTNVSAGDATLYVYNNAEVTFINKEYEVAVQVVNHLKTCVYSYLDISISIFDKTRKPHGLLGQTSSHTHAISSKIGGNNGEGEIEGSYRDYEVSGLFADDFKFNKYAM